MAQGRINGVPEEMRRKAQEISEFASDAEMNVLRIHAFMENMPSEQTWDDDNHRRCLERFAELRERIRGATQELQSLSTEIRGLASRYEI